MTLTELMRLVMVAVLAVMFIVYSHDSRATVQTSAHTILQAST